MCMKFSIFLSLFLTLIIRIFHHTNLYLNSFISNSYLLLRKCTVTNFQSWMLFFPKWKKKSSWVLNCSWSTENLTLHSLQFFHFVISKLLNGNWKFLINIFNVVRIHSLVILSHDYFFRFIQIVFCGLVNLIFSNSVIENKRPCYI